MAVKPGDILREKFRIDALIGRGGMGQVFAATDLRSQAEVAVKVVSRLLVDDVLMVRLHREAEAAKRIQSAFVPRVIEVSDTEEGETFLVMERLVGETLSQRIRDSGALPWTEVFHIGEDVLHGLVDAHAAGIVHRDLKPSNVFLALRESAVRAMVLDFGVCKMPGLDTERLTGTGESIGTVAYMAPEQIRGAARVDERADLFAFGVLVFEMVTGRLPHEGPSQLAILASKLEHPAASLGAFSRVETPRGVEELVRRALERDPDARFQSAGEVLDAWRALAASTDMIAPGSPLPVRAAGGAGAGAEPPTEVSRPPAALLALSVANQELGDSFNRGLVPIDSSPTPTALTTQHSALHRRSGNFRAALLLAALGLVAGLVVVVVSFRRGPDVAVDATARVTSSSAVSAEPTPPPLSPLPPENATPPEANVSDDGLAATGEEAFELPADPSPPVSTPGTTRSKPSRWRPRVAPPSPRSSGPRITAHPRY